MSKKVQSSINGSVFEQQMEKEDRKTASTWFMVQKLLEKQGEDGLTKSQIWKTLRDSVNLYKDKRDTIYLVGFNGTFHESLVRLVNLGVLEVYNLQPGFPDLMTYKVSKNGEELLNAQYKSFIKKYITT